MIETKDPVCVSDVILAETLPPAGYVRAAQLYRTCREEGMTIRKSELSITFINRKMKFPDF
jgi:hypothetical protein